MDLEGLGFQVLCRFGSGGVRLRVDRRVSVVLDGDVEVLVLAEDALVGGATVSSRWSSPDV